MKRDSAYPKMTRINLNQVSNLSSKVDKSRTLTCFGQIQSSVLKNQTSMELKQDYEMYLDSYQYSEGIKLCHHEPQQSLLEFPLKTVNTLGESKKSQQFLKQKQVESVSAIKCQKKKAKYINKCKTKNSLALFKTAHMKFLRRQGVQLRDWPRLIKFREKVGAAKDDFLKMYQQEPLRIPFKLMFDSKYLYRYLMTSRAFCSQKCVFLREITRLQEAFKQTIEEQ